MDLREDNWKSLVFVMNDFYEFIFEIILNK